MRRLLAAAMLALFPQFVQADLVTVVFEGVVTAENGGFPGVVGEPMIGSYTFDDTTPPLFPGFFLNAVLETEASFAGNTLAIDTAGDSQLSLSDGALDSYFVGGEGPGLLNGGDVGPSGFAIQLLDVTGTMLDNTAIATIPAFVPPINFATFQILDGAGEPAVSASLTMLTVAVPPIEVAIDLKPGSNPSTVNLGSQGVTPLAIFGSAEFDATQIAVSSLEINGVAASVKVVGNGKVLISLEDLNGDGFLDAVVKFETEGLALADNAPLTLTGTLIDGTAFTGDQPADDPVNIVP